MRQFLIAFLLIVGAQVGVSAQNASNTNPAVGTPLTGCVEGRALRIVNGMPSCAQTATPTLSACTGGSIDTNATDFIGYITIPAGVTTCTIVMTKLYATTFVCLIQALKPSIALTLGAQTVGNNGTASTLTVPFGLTLSATALGYICGPG